MPNNATAKTKSARRPDGSRRLIGTGLPPWLVAGTLVALALSALLVPGYSTVSLQIGLRTFTLQVADSDAARREGLSGRASLAAGSGMLFVYPNRGVRCFWMKGMRFPLDMIWLNAGKQVVHIQPDVSPNTYPQQFCPSQPAQYVIELHAGASAAADIRIGQLLHF